MEVLISMETYFVKTDDVDSLKLALGELIEYAKFLEGESGRSNDSYVMSNILFERIISV